MQFLNKITSLLGMPAIYRLFFRVIGADVRRIFTTEYVMAQPGDKVLDIGCGPGDILDYLPAVDYTGFDISERYIDAARSRFGSRGRFFCDDVAMTVLEEESGTFDIVLATGVLHHLDDDRAEKLLELAARALKPCGRFVSYDGCLIPEQTKLARWVLARDRGKHIRPKDEFIRLARRHFDTIETYIRHDLVLIPYTTLIMRCVR